MAEGPVDVDGWQHLDAVVLDNLGDPGSRTSLASIVGAVDFFERIVLTHEELQRVLRRLLGSDLATEVDRTFSRSAAGQEIHVLCPGKAERVRCEWIARHLVSSVACRSAEGWTLPQAAVRAAVDENRKAMARALAREARRSS